MEEFRFIQLKNDFEIKLSKRDFDFNAQTRLDALQSIGSSPVLHTLCARDTIMIPFTTRTWDPMGLRLKTKGYWGLYGFCHLFQVFIKHVFNF